MIKLRNIFYLFVFTTILFGGCAVTQNNSVSNEPQEIQPDLVQPINDSILQLTIDTDQFASIEKDLALLDSLNIDSLAAGGTLDSILNSFSDEKEYRDSLRSKLNQFLNDSVSSETKQKVKGGIEAPINYGSSDSLAFEMEDGKQIVYYYGNAEVKYGTIELSAGFIKVDLQSKEIYAEALIDSAGNEIGKPHFKEGAEEFDCETLRYNFETSKGFVTNVLTQQQDGVVHSERAKMVSKEVFCMVDGKYSTCDAEHPHFYLAMTKGKVIGKKAIITGRSYLVLEDFPIYFPFLPFGYIPTNSKTYSSGIIIPSYGEESNYGFFLKEGGFYWAASDYFDFTFKGDIYSKGGWATKLNTNYRMRYKFNGAFAFNYARTVTGEAGIDQSARKNFSVIWRHAQDSKANPSRTFSANVNFSTSGYDKTVEYANTNNYLQNSKSSSISYSKKFQNTPFTLSASFRHSQNSRDSTISLSLPDLNFNMKTIYPLKRKHRVGPKRFYEDVSLGYSLKATNKINSIKESLLLSTPLSTWDKQVRHSIPLSLPSFKLFNYINVNPGFNYGEEWLFDYAEQYWVDGYFTSNPETGKQQWVPGRIVVDRKDGFKRKYNYSYNLSSNTEIYGMYQMKNPNSKLKAIRHKMSPTIGFSYTPDFGEDRFGFYDWVQVDSLGTLKQYSIFDTSGRLSSSSGRSGSVNFGLKNNIEMKLVNSKDTTSTEKFKKVPIFDNLGFNGNYNLAADSMKLSNIAWNARTKVGGINLNVTGTLSPYALDERGRVYDEYMWNTATGLSRLGRITRASTGFGYSFDSKKIQKMREDKEKKRLEAQRKENGEEADSDEDTKEDEAYTGYAAFDMPWNFRFNYTFGYTNTAGKGKINQSLSFSGGITVTEKWSANFSSGYDFNAKKLTHTNMGVTRDLHCWSMAFNFSPIGRGTYYMFTLNANASMLKDLKVEKTQRGGRAY